MIHLAMTDLMARRLTGEATISWRDPTSTDQNQFRDETSGENDLFGLIRPVRSARRTSEATGCAGADVEAGRRPSILRPTSSTTPSNGVSTA
jgi:hypothetical protein